MGTVKDRFLLGMLEQKEERERRHEASSDRRSLLRYRNPIETLGFVYDEVPMFDVNYAKEYG